MQIVQQIIDKMGGMGHFRINAQTLYVMRNIFKTRGNLEMLCQPGEGGAGGVSDYSKWPPPRILLDIAKLFQATFDCHVSITIH